MVNVCVWIVDSLGTRVFMACPPETWCVGSGEIATELVVHAHGERKRERERESVCVRERERGREGGSIEKRAS